MSLFSMLLLSLLIIAALILWNLWCLRDDLDRIREGLWEIAKRIRSTEDEIDQELGP